MKALASGRPLPQSSGRRFFSFVKREGAGRRDRRRSLPVDVLFYFAKFGHGYYYCLIYCVANILSCDVII